MAKVNENFRLYFFDWPSLFTGFVIGRFTTSMFDRLSGEQDEFCQVTRPNDLVILLMTVISLLLK